MLRVICQDVFEYLDCGDAVYNLQHWNLVLIHKGMNQALNLVLKIIIIGINHGLLAHR